MEQNKDKKEFLTSEFFMNSWSAAAQRNSIYDEENDESAKKDMRKDIKEYLLVMLNEYEKGSVKTDEEHCRNIVKLYEYISTKYKGVIKNLTYGFVQKLLNMMIKYYWTAGFITEDPVHLPIDRINLETIGINDINWTKDIKSIEDYKNLIEKFKSAAESENKSLARWELENWKRRNS